MDEEKKLTYHINPLQNMFDRKELLKSLEKKGFSTEIVDAFSKVKRENFVLSRLEYRAYEDRSFPIGEGQAISQPYTIAEMLSLLELKKRQKVLEIGSGCGYVLALMFEITKGKVFGIERIKKLAEMSRINLKDYNQIKVYCRDGSKGLEQEAPFDRIIISAACEQIPEKLSYQLKNNGIIVAPIGSRDIQSVTPFKKINNKLIIKKGIPGFRFVPFIENNSLKN